MCSGHLTKADEKLRMHILFVAPRALTWMKA